MKNQPFSVAMCVYSGDNPKWFDSAIKSISINQTLKPSEIVLVVDGPVNDEINNVIEKYTALLKEHNVFFKVIRFENNQGHGNARRSSVANTSYEYVALMDADDIADDKRFEIQLASLSGTIDVCGGNISEFIGEESNVVSFRKVPEDDENIRKFAKTRCPMNQMTVMFKKSIYEKSGGYIDWFQDEDYYLWLRMMKNGAVFANSNSVLVNVRVGEEMYSRRGGWKYYKSEKRLQKYMLNEHFISFPKYLINCLKRFIVQVMMPNKIRGWFFKKVARSKQ